MFATILISLFEDFLGVASRPGKFMSGRFLFHPYPPITVLLLPLYSNYTTSVVAIASFELRVTIQSVIAFPVHIPRITLKVTGLTLVRNMGVIR
jgi:hypothetical protein